jgi:hypothetical protein
MGVTSDHVLVEIKKSEWATADEPDPSGMGKEDPNAGSGIVVGIPPLEDIMFFSSYNWILEQSVFNAEIAKKVHERMSALMGKKVYFEKRADVGNTIELDGTTFATIKLSKIVFVEEQ